MAFGCGVAGRGPQNLPVSRRSPLTSWARTFERSFKAITRGAAQSGARTLGRTMAPAQAKRRKPPDAGSWTAGLAVGAGGARRFWVYRPTDLTFGERVPLMVMLHGCGQDAKAFAASTRMNAIAQREGFLVLYPEQDRLANGHGCWNWFATDNGRAFGEAALILNAIDQVCLLYPADRERVVVAGMSAGASMAALLAARHPERFKAVVMHSGIPPGTAHSALSALRAMRGRRETAPLEAQRHWPPLLVIHGGADGVVAPQNGQAAAQAWADAAGAHAGATRTVQRGQRHPVEVTEFKFRGETVAKLMAVTRLAHAWSGGAAGQPYGDARGPDASRMAWAFAARQLRD